MAKIWRNRIESGAQSLSNCPNRYRTEVISLIRIDITEGTFTKELLANVVTAEEYKEITGEDLPINE